MSLIAWYKLQEDYKDSSGNGNDLNLMGSVPFVTGQIGQAASFTNNMANCLYRPHFTNLTQIFTISCRFMVTTINNTGAYATILSQGRDYLDLGWNLFLASTGELLLAIGKSGTGSLGGGVFLSLGFIELNKYYNVVIRSDDTHFSAFVNGILKQKKLNKRYTPLTYTQNTGAFVIGKMAHSYSGTGTYFPFNGTIEDVRIYDEALSDKEIKEISMAKLLHYKFDTPKGNTTNLCTHGHFDSLAFSYGVSGGTVTVNLLTGEGYEGRNAVYLKKSAGSGPGDWQIAWNGGFPVAPVAGETFYMSCKYKKESPDTYFYIGDWESAVNGEVPWWSVVADYSLGDGWFQLVCSRKFTSAVGAGFTYGLDSITPNKWIKICDFQLERYAPTPFVIGTRASDRIIDYSDWGNHSVPLVQNTQPMWVRDSALGEGCYDFSKTGNDTSTIRTTTLPIPRKGFTVCFWIKMSKGRNSSNTVSSHHIYFSGDGILVYGDRLILAVATDTRRYMPPGKTFYNDNKWHHFVGTYDWYTGKMTSYVDGEEIMNQTLTNKDITRPSTDFNISYSGFNTYGCIDDVRMYATALSAEDVLNIYKCRGSLGDKGDLHLNTIKTRSNLISKIQTALENKTFGNGLDYCPQPNCINTLTNNGFRIYRPANLLYSEAGSTMWGGLVLTIPEGTFIAGRKYKLKLQYKGKSTNGTQIFGAYMVGWSGYGALGTFTGMTKIKTTDNITTSGFNTESWHDIEITLEPTIANMYKAAVKTEHVKDDSITGKMYYLLNQFKIGFGYADTGALGTDMYLKNFRLYDITDESGEISIVDNKGVSHVDKFSEMGVTDGLIAYYPLDKDFKDYSGNGYHGTAYGTPALTDGINQKCCAFDGIDDYIETNFNQSLLTTGCTISLWVNLVKPTDGSLDGPIGSHGIGGNTGIGLQYYNGILQPIYGNGIDTWVGWRGFTTPDGIEDNTWVNIVFVFDFGKGIYKYINNRLIEAYLTTQPFYPSIQNKLYIGTGYTPVDATRFMKMLCQDVRVYDRPLGPDEIAINYEMSRPDYLDIGTTNLVASLPLNNTDVTDIGPYNLAVTSSNLTAVGEGLDDSACVFDGSTNWIDYSNIIPKIVGSSFSVSCFVYLTDNSIQRVFWGINVSTYSNRAGLGFFGDGFIHNGLSDQVSKLSSLHSGGCVNKWVNFVTVFDNTTLFVRTYADGVLILDTVGTSIVSTDKFSIGQEYDPSAVLSDFFAGRMQDFRVYNKVLSQDEITILANRYKNKRPKMKIASDGTVYINKVKEV